SCLCQAPPSPRNLQAARPPRSAVTLTRTGRRSPKPAHHRQRARISRKPSRLVLATRASLAFWRKPERRLKALKAVSWARRKAPLKRALRRQRRAKQIKLTEKRI